MRATPFRPDVEGLRAVAVLLVVLSHVGLPFLAGGYVGVDVFFVVSGFLITGLLLGEVRRTGRISVRRFYARRATRLLPAAALVLVATLLAAWAFGVPTRFGGVAKDALASAFYVANWRFAAEGTNYLAADAPPSPLQHLWSLGVEEQFYLVWPLLLLAVWRATARRADGPRGTRTAALAAGRLRLVLVVVLLGSLALSVRQSATSAPWAYFGTHTRAWELAAGALVATVADDVRRLPARVAEPLGWAGLGVVVGSAVVLDETSVFPGWVALAPVLGTVAVVVAGAGDAPAGPVALLGTAPLQRIGALSYAWYLWHWPVLVLGPVALGLDPSLPLLSALAAVSLGLAAASYRLVENPVRRSGWLRARAPRGLAVGLALTTTCALLAGVSTRVQPSVPTTGTALDPADVVVRAAERIAPTPSPSSGSPSSGSSPASGATGRPDAAAEAAAAQAALTRLVATSARRDRIPAGLTPPLAGVGDALPRIYADGCHAGYAPKAPTAGCVYGDRTASRTMVLIGDSHAAHWFAAFDTIARERGMRLVTMTKAACGAASVPTWSRVFKRPYTECDAYREAALRQVVAMKPDLVVLSQNGGDSGGLVGTGGRQLPGGRAADARWVQGWVTTATRLAASGARVVQLQDTPWPQGSAPDCLATNPERTTTCNRPVAAAVQEQPRRRLVAAALRGRGVTVVDPVAWFCTATTCPPVIGDVLVYRDDSHVTDDYALAVAPLLAAALPAADAPPVAGAG